MTESNNTLPPKPVKSSADAATPDTSSTQPENAAPDSSGQANQPPATPKQSANPAPDKPEQGLPEKSQPEKNKAEQNNKASAAKAAPPTPPSKKPGRPAHGTSTPPPQKSGAARFALLLSLVALICVAGAALYFWQKQLQQISLVEQARDQANLQKQNLDALQSSVQQQLSKLDERSFIQQNNIAQISQQVAFNAQQLIDLGARSRMDWLLAEAEYLMRLANQRLNLQRDINSAEAMLSSADSILAEINDPGLIEIRKTLADEILSLQQTPHIDYQGLYFKLDAIIQSLDSLQQQAYLSESTQLPPVLTSNSSEPAVPQEASISQSLLAVWQTVWHDLKNIVTIRRLDEPLPPLLAPEQHYYLKQNLRLMLEQAGLALLEENAPVYQASLKKAETWLSQYFLQSDPAIQQIQQALKALAQNEIATTLPDISHSLRLTKARIESFYRRHTLNKLNTESGEPRSSAARNPNEPDNSSTDQKGAAL